LLNKGGYKASGTAALSCASNLVALRRLAF
jgi:hypothetical protein